MSREEFFSFLNIIVIIYEGLFNMGMSKFNLYKRMNDIG